MAVIHISEVEATENLLSLMERAQAGEEVRIDTGAGVIAFSKVSPAETRRKTLTEAIRLAKERTSRFFWTISSSATWISSFAIMTTLGPSIHGGIDSRFQRPHPC